MNRTLIKKIDNFTPRSTQLHNFESMFSLLYPKFGFLKFRCIISIEDNPFQSMSVINILQGSCAYFNLVVVSKMLSPLIKIQVGLLLENTF